jgi:hypothetical protein
MIPAGSRQQTPSGQTGANMQDVPDFQIRFLSIEQMTFTSPTCKVLIRFEIDGPKSGVDIVQVYAVNAANAEPSGLGDVVDSVDMTIAEAEYPSVVDLQAGAAYQIHLCPRSKTGDQLDDQTEGAYWETFCIAQTFVTQAPGQPTQTYPVPVITSFQSDPADISRPNRITVSWTSAQSYDKFLVWWLIHGMNIPQAEGEIDSGGYSGSWTAQPTQPNVLYDFSLKGGLSAFWNFIYSDWSPPLQVRAAGNLTSLRKFITGGGTSSNSIHIRPLMKGETSIRKFMHLS